jgi:membrane fusion protein (multidrug efflux system)
MKMTKKTAFAALTAGIVLATVLIIVTWPGRREVPDDAGRPVPVSVVRAGEQGSTERIRLAGRLEAWTDVLLSAEKPGRVAELTAEKGQRVEQGQVLMRVDDRTWKAFLDRAELHLDQTRRDLARYEELGKSGAVPVSELESLRRQNQAAEAAVREARANHEQCEVRSPITGIVQYRMVEIGEHVGEGAPVYQVVDSMQLKLKFDLPEKDVRFVVAGQGLTFQADAMGGLTFTGVVTFVAPQASLQNNAFACEARVDNRDQRLHAGLIARILLERPARAGHIRLPLSAVLPLKGEHVVFIVQGDRVVRRTVTLETIEDNMAMVSAGLEAGQLVVADGNRALADGARVSVVGASEKAGGESGK